MKKILFLILILFISTKVFAICIRFDRTKCPTTVCPSGTFMGDDGKCYECNDNRGVEVRCIGADKVFQICPNRFTYSSYCGGAFSLSSRKECFKSKDLLYFFVPFFRLGFVDTHNHICDGTFYYYID